MMSSSKGKKKNHKKLPRSSSTPSSSTSYFNKPNVLILSPVKVTGDAESIRQALEEHSIQQQQQSQPTPLRRSQSATSSSSSRRQRRQGSSKERRDLTTSPQRQRRQGSHKERRESSSSPRRTRSSSQRRRRPQRESSESTTRRESSSSPSPERRQRERSRSTSQRSRRQTLAPCPPESSSSSDSSGSDIEKPQQRRRRRSTSQRRQRTSSSPSTRRKSSTRRNKSSSSSSPQRRRPRKHSTTTTTTTTMPKSRVASNTTSTPTRKSKQKHTKPTAASKSFATLWTPAEIEAQTQQRTHEALVRHAYHLPNYDYTQDWKQYLANHHPLMAVMCSRPCLHTQHPLSWSSRLLICGTSMLVGLTATTGLVLWQQVSTASWVTELLASIPLLDAPHEAWEITNGTISLWTWMAALHATWDVLGWKILPMCLPIQLSMLHVLLFLTWLVLSIAISATLASQWSKNNDDDDSTLSDHALSILLSACVEWLCAWLLWYPIVATILFTGILGRGYCCVPKIPILGGRPFELQQWRQQEETIQKQQPVTSMQALAAYDGV